MADDLNQIFLAIGRLQTAVEEAKAQNVEIKDAQRIAADRAEVNKNLAIKAREDKETREEQRAKQLEGRLTETYGIATTSAKWITEKGDRIWTWHHDEGSKLGSRVSILEQSKVAEATEKARADKLQAGRDGEKRGGKRVWAAVWAAIVAVVVAVVTYGKDALEFLKGLHHG